MSSRLHSAAWSQPPGIDRSVSGQDLLDVLQVRLIENQLLLSSYPLITKDK